MNRKMTAEEKKWQAQDDANILARYQELISDKTRLSAAKKEAKNQAQELNKRINALNKASKTKNTK